MNQMIFAFSMTLIAGMCTGIGSVVGFLSKSTNRVFLSVSLGFSGGVMLYVSMIEIFGKADELLGLELGMKGGSIATVVAFFGGMFLIAIIDQILPEADHNQLMRMGTFTAVAIAIHNFPEGLATFISAMQEPAVGIPIVIAIAMHNIPEGIAVSVPVYYATGSKKKAFFYSFASGLTEPLGALLGWLLLSPIMNEVVYGIIFASVAGIMVFISLNELLPCAREYGGHKHTMYGMILGMIVMAISLLLFM